MAFNSKRVDLSAKGVDDIWEHATSDADNAGTFGRVLNEWENGGRLDLILDDVLADTNSLQGEWANGGRLDLILDKTDVQSAAFVDEAYDIQNSSVSCTLGGTDTTNLVNVTESGILVSVACIVQTAPSGANPDNELEITIDGGTKRNIALWNGATTWGIGELRPYATIGDGSSVDDRFVLNFGIRYKTSLLIAFDRIATAGGGQVRFSIFRGAKL